MSDRKEDLSIYKKVLETLPMPVLLVGADEHILFMNKTYGEFLGVDPQDVIGHHVYEVIPNSRTPLVLKTQKAEYADRHKYVAGKIKGQEIIVHRIPIVENGKTLAVFGLLLFTSIEDLMALAEKNQKINDELAYYKNQFVEQQSSKYSLDSIIGTSPAIKNLKEQIVKVARLKQTILITGESGVGKELIAHSIHHCSERHDRMFVRVNCAAIPENLFESEFFGYVGGSFSGASKTGKKGKFELAEGGTLFLDEIGELPLFMQSKLLRVLQEREITRVGGSETIPVDVRIVAATNRNLLRMVQEGTFRQDLYYRLNILNIKAPSLREHMEDISLLLEKTLNELQVENGMKKRLSADALDLLQKYSWPGNIRELNNIITKLYYMSDSDEITAFQIPRHIRYAERVTPTKTEFEGMDSMIEELEKYLVIDTLKRLDNNVTKTANTLKISRPRLYRIMEKILPEELEK